MDKKAENIPLSESSVSLRLANIQERCSQLLQTSEELGDLSLVDHSQPEQDYNPYDHG